MNNFEIANILINLQQTIYFLEGMKHCHSRFSYPCGITLRNQEPEPMRIYNKLLNEIQSAENIIHQILKELGNYNSWNISYYRNLLNDLLTSITYNSNLLMQ